MYDKSNPTFSETRVPNFQRDVNSSKYSNIIDALTKTQAKEQEVYVIERNNQKLQGFEHAWSQLALPERISLLTQTRQQWRTYCSEDAVIINAVLKKELQGFANHNLCNPKLRRALNKLIQFKSDGDFAKEADHTAALAQTYLTLFDRDFINPVNNPVIMSNHVYELKQLEKNLPGASNMGLGLLGVVLLALSLAACVAGFHGTFSIARVTTTWVLSLLALELAPFAVVGAGALCLFAMNSSVAEPAHEVAQAVKKYPSVIDDQSLTEVATQASVGLEAKPTPENEQRYESVKSSVSGMLK